MTTILHPSDPVARPATHPSRPSVAVDFVGVSRWFGDVRALDDLDLSIGIGETVALLGPNGAGKSTAIGLMLGLVAPTAGHVTTLGLDPRQAVASGRIGAMLQQAVLPTNTRVGELVEFGRGLYPNPLPAAEIVERAGLGRLVRRRTDGLSGGESQRVRFALAIAGDPDLVFLDEPTVAMDVETRRAFWADMRRSATEGRTILFATHYLDEADQVADRIVVLDHGRVVADGTGRAIRSRVSGRTIRFDLTGPRDGRPDRATLRRLPAVTDAAIVGDAVVLSSADADETVRALYGAGIPLRDLEVRSAGLEEAFLALTDHENPEGASR